MYEVLCDTVGARYIMFVIELEAQRLADIIHKGYYSLRQNGTDCCACEVIDICMYISAC